MKKLVLLLAVSFSVSMFSCGGGEKSEGTEDSCQAQTEEQAPATEEQAAPEAEATPAEGEEAKAEEPKAEETAAAPAEEAPAAEQK